MYNETDMTSYSQKNSAYKIFIYALILAISIFYIVYRCTATLPLGLRPIDIIFAFIILLVEIIETFEFIIYFCNNLIYKKKSPKTPKIKPEKLEEVDVFIATLNEEDTLLEETLKACSKLEYPKSVHIYLCDDGERNHLKPLAEKYGATYLARKSHYSAKAGNYNYALKHSSSPYIALFDADMRPKKNFLLETMPFFIKYKKVGFVQTPQSFQNPDFFQARFSKKMPCEQDYFYKHIQLARNNINSTILCGTNCVISRQALKEVGGFSQSTIAEDIATGMLIESKGYRAFAIKKVLARGETADNYHDFLRQRSRWGRGCIQTAKFYSILRIKGLTCRQKLDYLVAINYWHFGVRRLLFLALPLLFVFFNIIAIEANLKFFIPLFLVQYILKRFVIDITDQNHRSATWNKIYEIIQMPYLAIINTKELLHTNREFIVTPKKAVIKTTAIDYYMLAVHFILLLVSGAGLSLAIYKSQLENFTVYIIPIIWIFANLCYLLVAVIFDLRTSTRDGYDPKSKKKYGFSSFLSILWRKK